MIEFRYLKDFYVKAFKSVDEFMQNEVQTLCVPNGMNAWVNSYKLNQDDNFISNGSWAEGLFEGCMTLKMLESTSITNADYFTFIEGAGRGTFFYDNSGFNTEFTNINSSSQDPTTNPYEFTAKGIVLSMIGEAMSSCSGAVKIDFPGAPLIKAGEPYKTVYGWRFEPTNLTNQAKQAVIINVGHEQVVDLSQILGVSSGTSIGVEEVYCFNDGSNFYVTPSAGNNPVEDTYFSPIAFVTGTNGVGYYGYNLTLLSADASGNYQSLPLQHNYPIKVTSNYRVLNPYSILRVFEIKTSPVGIVSSNHSCGNFTPTGTTTIDDVLAYHELEGGGTDAINCHADGAAKYTWDLQNGTGSLIAPLPEGNNVSIAWATAGTFTLVFNSYDGVAATPLSTTSWTITINAPPDVSFATAVTSGNHSNPCWDEELSPTATGIVTDGWWWSPTGNIFPLSGGTQTINTQNARIFPSVTTNHICMGIDNNGCYGIAVEPVSMPAVNSSWTVTCLDASNTTATIGQLQGPNCMGGCTYRWTGYKWNFQDPVNLGTTQDLNLTEGMLQGIRYVICKIDNTSCVRNYFYDLNDLPGNNTRLKPTFDLFYPPDYCAGDDISIVANDDDIQFPNQVLTYTWAWTGVNGSPTFNNATYTAGAVNIGGDDDVDARYHGNITATTGNDYTFTVTGTESSGNTTVTCQGSSDAVSETFHLDGTSPIVDFSPAYTVVSGIKTYSLTAGCSLDITASAPVTTGETQIYEWEPFDGLNISGVYTATVTASPSVSTTYTVFCKKTGVAGNAMGCCNQEQVAVDIEPMVCSNCGYMVDCGGSTTLTLNTAGFTCSGSFQWYKNGVAIGGATNSTYIVALTGADDGVYYATYNTLVISPSATVGPWLGLPNANPCRLEESEDVTGENIVAYPNPNEGSFYLQLNGNENETGILSLYDLCGKQFFASEIELTGGKPIHLSFPDNIAEGIYLLSFRNNTINTFLKIIIDRP